MVLLNLVSWNDHQNVKATHPPMAIPSPALSQGQGAAATLESTPPLTAPTTYLS